MPKDLKEVLQQEIKDRGNLSKNHRANFEALLQKELHTSKKEKVSNF